MRCQQAGYTRPQEVSLAKRMSEPVTHAEIEDVLSSIRRLVSETGRGAEAGTVRIAPKPATRLVLTPALRVPDADLAGPAPNYPAASRAEPEAVTSTPDPVCRTPQPRVAEVERSASVNAPAPSAPEPVTSAEAAPRILAARATSKPSLPSAEAAAVATEAPSLTEQLTFRIREHVAAIERRDETGAGEESAPDDVSGGVGEMPRSEALKAEGDAPWQDPAATLYEAAQGGDTASAAEPVEEKSDAVADSLETLSYEARPDLRPQFEPSPRVAAVVRRIAELETAGRNDAGVSSGGVPDLNEDEIEAVPASGPSVDTIQWEDHLEAPLADSVGAVQADSPLLAEEDAALTQAAAEELTMERLATQEDFLDEESLRALVADIVREELQGALGERITRNVRKLVRREIQRALAAQDLL